MINQHVAQHVTVVEGQQMTLAGLQEPNHFFFVFFSFLFLNQFTKGDGINKTACINESRERSTESDKVSLTPGTKRPPPEEKPPD